MTYTIKITDNQTELAKSLLFYLKSLTKSPEYSFLEIEQDKENELSDEIKEELDFRLEHFEKNKHNFNNWDDIKYKYLKV
jgi:hypothetical protein